VAGGRRHGRGRPAEQGLHFARRALGRDHLRLHDGLLSLVAGTLWVDLDALEAAAGRGDTDDALALYTGELLPENRFDDWVEPRRAQLHATVARLLLDQAADRADREDPAAAVAALERLVALDPLNEEAYARLMRLTAAAGARHVALRWYDRLTEALHEHLGVEPNDDLRALQADIAAGRLGPSPVPATGPSPLPGAGPAAGAEERKLVTVLDMDLRGLPAPPGQGDPERARRETITWTDLFCEVVGRWGGAVQRHVGGGVVTVFGYPAAREDHAARALWAGFEVLQRTAAPVRMGVDTGEVIAPTRPGWTRDRTWRSPVSAGRCSMARPGCGRRPGRGHCWPRSVPAGPPNHRRRPGRAASASARRYGWTGPTGRPWPTACSRPRGWPRTGRRRPSHPWWGARTSCGPC
jgi:hypothetical protein